MIAQTQQYCGKSNLNLSPIGVDVWVSPILGNGLEWPKKNVGPWDPYLSTLSNYDTLW